MTTNEPDAGDADVIGVLGEHQRTLDAAGSCCCGNWPPPTHGIGWNVHLADMLAPALATREREAEQRGAGKALRDAADDCVGMGQGQTRDWLRARADATRSR